MPGQNNHGENASGRDRVHSSGTRGRKIGPPMVSIFATNLTHKSPASGMPSGAIHSCDAIALAVDLAGHFGLSFADVEQRLSAILPNSLDHLHSADGWRLFGQYLAAFVPTTAPEYRPMIH